MIDKKVKKEEKKEGVLKNNNDPKDLVTKKDDKKIDSEKEKKGDIIEKSQKSEKFEEKSVSEKKESSELKDNKIKNKFTTEKKGFGGQKFKKNFKRRSFKKREKSEFEQKIVSLRRVTRVMAGGRRFSFSAAIVVGDRNGRVGFGVGKSNDTSSAIDKAVREAKKTMVRVKLTDDNSIPYDVSAKYKASIVQIRPMTGKGLSAGGTMRIVLEFAGVKQAGAKILSRSKNPINNAKACLEALKPFSKKVETASTKTANITRKKILTK
ncbi:MAG: 30S ribosomal protein S5 [Candidatus Pacebacteria bacterium]|nr:30S ribosomal protein S5 [Candidatus Paceibacterota bacterium]